MKTVLAFGTFDVLHPGHEFFLRKARALGERLVVIVARDGNVERLKKITPHDSEQVRRANVQALIVVDEARLGYEVWGKHLQVLDDVQPDVIALGYDQHARLPEGPWTVVVLPAFKPNEHKSSIVRKAKQLNIG